MFGADAQLQASGEQCHNPYTCNCVCASICGVITNNIDKHKAARLPFRSTTILGCILPP